MLNIDKFILKKTNGVKLLFSDDFRNILNLINNEVSIKFLNSYNILNSKYTHIDIEDENYISYVYHIDVVNKNFNNRIKMKIGRFVKKLFRNSFDEHKINDFINSYKFLIREDKIYFKIYKGKDIKKWYYEKNNEELGLLGNSCMRYKRCLEYLNLYTNNSKKISLLVLFEVGNVKSIGRSLIWELSDKSKLMDKIYIKNDYDKGFFINYSYDNNVKLTIDDDPINGIKDIWTKLKPRDYDYYPYLDTFKIYQPETGLITDTIKYCDLSKKIYILDDIYGLKRIYKQ